MHDVMMLQIMSIGKGHQQLLIVFDIYRLNQKFENKLSIG
jgi:hypothetical protein